MTFDTAVWKPGADRGSATSEFERRMDASEARYPDYRPPIPELLQLADLMEAEFPGRPPWEELRGSLDGDFVYLTMTFSEGAAVQDFMARQAPALGLVVYCPQSEDFVGPGW